MRTTSEYDAFGPWIDEVHSIEQLPRLYRTAGIDPADYRLVLKVPRNIARRDATPDMHLYDYLLAVGDATMIVLARHGDTYQGLQIPFEVITAIEDSVALLDGRLTVHTANGGQVTIPYNGSASAPVQELVRLLRAGYLPPAGQAPPPPDGTEPALDALDLGVGDIDLVTTSGRALRSEPGMRLVGAITRHAVTPATGWVDRYLHRLWPVTLQAAVVVADDREVRIFHRRRWLTRSTDAAFSLAQTVLPLARVSAVRVTPHERYRQVQVVTVHAGATSLRLPAPAGAATDVLLAPFGRLAPRCPMGQRR